MTEEAFNLFYVTAADILGRDIVWMDFAFVCSYLLNLMRHLGAAVTLTGKVIAVQKQ